MDLFGNSYSQFTSHLSILFYILFFVLLHFLAEPARWIIYTSARGLHAYKRYFSIFNFSALSSYIIPFKLGIPFRVYLLNKKADLTLQSITSILLADGLLYYTGWFTAAAWSVYIILPGSFIDIRNHISFLSITLIFILIIVFFIILYIIKSKTVKLKIHNKICWIKDTFLLLREIRISQYLQNTIIVFLDIIGQVLRHYFLLKLIGIDIPLIQVMGITSLGIFAGMASMMPMGLVGYDATIILLLRHAGIGLETAVLLPILNRAFSITVSIILGIWGALTLGYTPMKGIRRIRTLVEKR